MNRKHFVLIGVLLTISLIAGCNFFGGEDGRYDTFEIQRGELLQEVDVTGLVVPQEKADLAFENSGRITEILVDVGDQVEPGDTLAIQDNRDISADISEALAKLSSEQARLKQIEAQLASEQAQLDELISGTRQEELQIAQTEVSNAERLSGDLQRILDEEQLISTSRLSRDERALEDARDNYNVVLEQAETDLKNLYEDIPDLVREAVAVSYDAVRAKTDALFVGNEFTSRVSETSQYYGSYDPTFETVSARDIEIEVSERRKNAKFMLAEWEKEVSSLASETNQELLSEALTRAETNSKEVLTFLERARLLLNKADPQESQTTISGFRSDVNEAINNINDVLEDMNQLEQDLRRQEITNRNTITLAQEKLNLAEDSLEVTRKENQQRVASAEANLTEARNQTAMARDELSLKEAGSRVEQVSAQRARVRQQEANRSVQYSAIRQAQAEVASLEAQKEKTILRSPIAGIVTRQDAELGEIIGANEIFMAVISGGRFEIEADIPEISISGVAVGQMADVYLDAYGDDLVFAAEVMKIDPAETIIDEVTHYQTTLRFAEQDERIKSGMTANITIITASLENVLTVPERSLLTTSEGSTAQKIISDDKGKPEWETVEVLLGAKSSDGFREILGGLQEGDLILLNPITESE